MNKEQQNTQKEIVNQNFKKKYINPVVKKKST